MKFQKGHTPWNKGLSHSPETIKKLQGIHTSPGTEYKKGHKPSEETRKKQSESAKRRFADPTEKEKQSARLSGRKNPEHSIKMKKCCSGQEYKKQLSDNTKKLWKNLEYRKNQLIKMKKRWEDPEYRKRQSEAHYQGGPKIIPKKYATEKERRVAFSKHMKELWATEEFRKKMVRTDEWKEKISKANKGRKREPYSKELIQKMLRRNIPTSLEVAFLNIVKKHNLPYKYVGDGSVIIGRKNPDFININGKKIAVEVYARYYKNRDQRFKDIDDWKEKRREAFGEYGWDLVFFDETQVKEDVVLKSLGGD